ncbi:PqqD family protein [Tissierella carlieri]|uniref:PqqD family protein n=1 Tax=Tissierella carlieri TaxID=689904 RepID=UPI001C1268FE|nr:PqqD family protein [Tissierella carlieri]MBU5310667.1 PqqD family protein [Tissierella carlieri]MDU5080946.1 PqqD family protein [Bacillota bacterium]
MKIYYSKNISWQLIDNQIFIIDEVTKKEFTLKEIGKEFWILIKSHNLYKEIVEILSEQYDVANDIITSDLKEFVEDLISKKLLTKGEDCYES